MSSWWRVVVVLALLLLPVGGYAAWSLAAGPPDDPAPRAPMQLRPAGEIEDDGGDTTVPTPGGSREPEPVRPRLGDLDGDWADD